ncbi:unnamed protein product [Lota lota]
MAALTLTQDLPVERRGSSSAAAPDRLHDNRTRREEVVPTGLPLLTTLTERSSGSPITQALTPSLAACPVSATGCVQPHAPTLSGSPASVRQTSITSPGAHALMPSPQAPALVPQLWAPDLQTSPAGLSALIMKALISPDRRCRLVFLFGQAFVDVARQDSFLLRFLPALVTLAKTQAEYFVPNVFFCGYFSLTGDTLALRSIMASYADHNKTSFVTAAAQLTVDQTRSCNLGAATG